VKIVVSASPQPHALSRREIEAIFATLPSDLTADIAEFDLETGPWHDNRFEYVASQRRARFAFVVPEKTAATTTAALRVLLDGLARLKTGERFFERVRRDRVENEEFIAEWLPTCLRAVEAARPS
jgi:hypothetical protein